MTWVLIGGVILIAAGCFAAGAACGPWLRSARHRLAALLREAPPLQEHHGHHRAGTAPSALLTSEQVAGHADAMWQAGEEYLPPSPAGEHPYPPYVPAWQPIERKPTEDHAPWTGSQPALDDEVEAEMDRVRYIRAQLAECGDRPTADDLRRVLDSLRRPVYGEAPQLEVREAEAAPPFPYDPGYDNCAGTPGCGSERVFYKWYGMEQTICPRCYMNVFGGEPDPSSVHQIAEVREAGRLADVMRQ